MGEIENELSLRGAHNLGGSFEKLQGSKAGLHKVLAGLHSYTNSEHQRCHGFLAYEDAPGDEVVVSFYTAVHCLEARDPLGRLRDVAFKLQKSLKFKELKSHFKKDVELKSGREHLFQYPSGRIGDVARFQQDKVSKSFARANLLPVCAENTVNTGYLQAVGTAKFDEDRQPSWANFECQGKMVGIPLDTRNLMLEMGIHPEQGRASVVRTRPGDSGSPVIMIQPQQGLNPLRSVQEYKCLFGVVTRELWTDECKHTARAKVCSSWGDSLFERTYEPNIATETGSWQPARSMRAYERVEAAKKRKKAEEDRRKRKKR